MAEPGPEPAVWLVDKPPGPTSHDIVATVRRGLARRAKVGHAGTLDPFATGLLVILVGSATRLSPYLTGLDKRYDATFQLGQRSATLDPEGPITAGGSVPGRAAIEDALAAVAERDTQATPAFSAARVGGERLWRAARRGEVSEGPRRRVAIHELALRRLDADRGRADVAVHCGSGTYVRQIAGDVGEVLGCGAYCAALRRTAVGPWSVADAVAPDEVTGRGGLDLRQGLPDLGLRQIDAGEARAIADGRAIPAGAISERIVALVDDRRLHAIAERDADVLRPRVVLR